MINIYLDENINKYILAVKNPEKSNIDMIILTKNDLDNLIKKALKAISPVVQHKKPRAEIF